MTAPPVLPPATALAWSEARLDDRQERGPCLGLWRPEGVTAAIGLAQRPAVELDTEAIRRDGVRLVRRQSGGGAVLLYEGVLCWEAWAGLEEIAARSPDGDGIRPAYRVLCGPLRRGLARLGLEVFHAGVSDISFSRPGERPRKIAGTAQLRRKDMALVHGSLLVCADLRLLARYLKFPSAQPEYREDRTHRDFCLTVAELLGCVGNGGRAGDLIGLVARNVAAAAREGGWRLFVPPGMADCAGGGERLAALRDGKYCADGWNWEKIRP